MKVAAFFVYIPKHTFYYDTNQKLTCNFTKSTRIYPTINELFLSLFTKINFNEQ